MSKTLNDQEMQKVSLILQFLEVTKVGLVKPFDPTHFLKKLDSLEKEGVNVGNLRDCCPTGGEISDAKDFKPYIMAALEEFGELMGLNVQKYKTYGKY